jgi:sulfur carrier protein
MRIVLNGNDIDTEAASLADLIEAEGFTAEIVATAVNGEFVPRAVRTEQTLRDGDRVEVFSPRQGG